jgi:hypothetical protein
MRLSAATDDWDEDDDDDAASDSCPVLADYKYTVVVIAVQLIAMLYSRLFL